MKRQRIEPEDLKAWLDNYQRYLDAIARLDDEILAKETEINRFGGSIIRQPEARSDSTRLITRQRCLLNELDALVVDRDFYQSRVKVIHLLRDWSASHDDGWHIVLQRKLETGQIYADELIGISQRQQHREFMRILKNFLKIVF